MSLKACLVIAALFGSVSVGSAAPNCPSKVHTVLWEDGTTISERKSINVKQGVVSGVTFCFLEEYNSESSYIGTVKWYSRDELLSVMGSKEAAKQLELEKTLPEFKYVDGYFFHGQGVVIIQTSNGDEYKSEGVFRAGNEHGYARRNNNGKVQQGMFIRGVFQGTPLRIAFVNYSKGQRKLIQSSLADLGFYKSSIDGLYGKGTAAALKAYNKEYLGNADLSTTANANALIADLLKGQPVVVDEAEVVVTANAEVGETELADPAPVPTFTFAQITLSPKISCK